MRCPDCGYENTGVIDTRDTEKGNTVRRRRECRRCGFRFTTYERPEWESLQVKKRDGSIEPYQREKIRRGIELAVEKRPVSKQKVEKIVDQVEEEIKNEGTQIVSSRLIGQKISEKLRETDKVAYIRFVSVYKAFEDPEEFIQELDKILQENL